MLDDIGRMGWSCQFQVTLNRVSTESHRACEKVETRDREVEAREVEEDGGGKR